MCEKDEKKTVFCKKKTAKASLKNVKNNRQKVRKKEAKSVQKKGVKIDENFMKNQQKQGAIRHLGAPKKRTEKQKKTERFSLRKEKKKSLCLKINIEFIG